MVTGNRTHDFLHEFSCELSQRPSAPNGLSMKTLSSMGDVVRFRTFAGALELCLLVYNPYEL